jgi:hypothetical protein
VPELSVFDGVENWLVSSDLRAFLIRQCSLTVSAARASHYVSSSNSVKVTVARNFTVLSAGRPSGFSSL